MTRFKLGRDECGQFLDDTYTRQKPLRVNFADPEFLYRVQRTGKKTELVARAVKARAGLRVLDCTGGLGLDAFILAYLGCHVTVAERSRVLATLLDDGMARARLNPTLASAAQRLSLVKQDAAVILASEKRDFDVAYLDPMFPEKQGSASVKGGMQLLQRYLGTDEDASALLDLALASTIEKVVLKRPPRSDWEPPRAPNHVLTSRNSRYEVYLKR